MTADGTEAGYAACRRIVRRAGTNFYPCFLLLSGPKRRGMEALYAFLRTVDDLGDGDLPLGARREQLAAWRQAVTSITNGAPEETTAVGRTILSVTEQTTDKIVRPTIATSDGSPVPGAAAMILPALADTVRRFAIPVEHLVAAIDGVEMDLETTTYAAYDDLTVYLDRVASAVGLACLPIWGWKAGIHPDSILPAARSCGRAFQLTNILRDLREDSQRGRCYLPLEDLARAGYSREELTAGVVNAAFDRLVDLQAARIRCLFHEGADLLDSLSPQGQRVFGLMTSVYAALADEVFARRREVFARRIRIGWSRKLRLVLRWTLLPPRRTSLP